jgi:membrane fusion protein (multidrug efflux system)
VSATFSQTTRVLAADRPRGALVALALSLPLLAGWIAWFLVAEVTVHEITDAGRIEVAEASHDVDAPIGGRVVATRIVLGLDVREGDVLVELDAETEKRRLAEERTRLASIEPEVEARQRQLAAIELSVLADRDTTVTSLAQARARKDEAAASAEQVAEEARRAETLHRSGAISEIEMMRARTEAARARSALGAAALELARLEGAQRTRDVQGRSRAEDLRSEIASLDGQKERARAAIAVLEHEISKRSIRAGVSGRLGEVAKIGVGQFLKEGERLASIVPSGGLRAVAEFPPEATLGRVRPGQSARMRMQGFPWTQYGTVPASVANVGSELRDGKVRVELRLEPSPTSRIPLGHGMPGSVEVDVDRETPAHLVFRAAGRLLGKPVPSQGTPD